ncbi:MAG: helix-turn-helix transcriptional regulator, partial [Clostridiales bacterium]|nr:helix-turn-helix transcriptional regulator [Clostridiales bacterium]
MAISKHQYQLIHAFCEFSRIPLWFYDTLGNLSKSILHTEAADISNKLIPFMNQTYKSLEHNQFSILCLEQELYISFPYFEQKKKCSCILGPLLLNSIYTPGVINYFSFFPYLQKNEQNIFLDSLPVLSLPKLSSCLNFLYLVLRKENFDMNQINEALLVNLNKNTTTTLIHQTFENREDTWSHTSYREELAILNCVRQGQISHLEETYTTLPPIKYGNMSPNPLRQLFYGCIANTTLVTRAAIEGGLEEETALTLSDVYIKQMEQCKSISQLNLLNENMALDFTTRVAKKKALSHTSYSKPVSESIDYIFLNLHQKITLESVAKKVHLSAKYLSFLFQKETGRGFTSFIMERRMEEAKNLLLYSDFSIQEISNYLIFSSQSHFIFTFRKHTAMTP